MTDSNRENAQRNLRDLSQDELILLVQTLQRRLEALGSPSEPSGNGSQERADRLRQIANLIESRPVLGHWPAMLAAPDAEFLRKVAADCGPPEKPSAVLDHRFLPDGMDPGICQKCGSTRTSHRDQQ